MDRCRAVLSCFGRWPLGSLGPSSCSRGLPGPATGGWSLHDDLTILRRELVSGFTNPSWLPFYVSEAATAGSATSEDLQSGAAWDHLLEKLGRARDVVLSDAVPNGPVDMTSGFRHLLVLMGAGIDELLRRGLDTVPSVKPSAMDAAFKWGMECPDCIYFGSALRGTESYRLWGKRGSARYVGLQVMSGMASTFNALLDDFELGPGGEFELVLSAEQHDGNWVPLPENATALVIRHFFYDWEQEVPADLSIEPLAGTAPVVMDAPADPRAALARQLVALGDFVEENLTFFLSFSVPAAVNSFLPPLDGAAMGAAAENRPVIGSWKLAPDEALMIEVEPPEGLYWSFSLGNAWWETIDYGNRQSSLNGHQAVVDEDGKVRVVVAHQDPGVANWLDTAGHSAGPIILRCVRTQTAPVPAVEVVPFDRLGERLPEGTCRLSAGERAAVIQMRRRAVSRRFPR